MKSIELTEEHKSKLLEMCKVLFPESKIQFTDDYYCEWSLFLITEDDNDRTLPKNKVECHWFEFCTNEIVNELAWRNIQTDILADCEYEDFRMKLITKIFKDKLVGNNFHIIDYLYKQFKKLK